MDKEKEIEQMAESVCDICFNAPHGIPCPEEGCKDCSFAKRFAKELIEVFNRKAMQEIRCRVEV